MDKNSVKSATTAGILGILLGSIGVHDFYLGETKKGIIHVCLAAGSILLSTITSAVMMRMSFSALVSMSWLFTMLGGLSTLVACGNGIWGFVEGVIILAQGDAGLAQKGYKVAGQSETKMTDEKKESDKK